MELWPKHEGAIIPGGSHRLQVLTPSMGEVKPGKYIKIVKKYLQIWYDKYLKKFMKRHSKIHRSWDTPSIWNKFVIIAEFKCKINN